MMDIKKTLNALKSARQTIEGTWRECYDYTLPLRGVGLNSGYSGQGQSSNLSQANTRKSLIFDGTAADAVKLMASFIVSGMLPSSTRWIDFEIPSRPDYSNSWLDNAADVTWREIHAGNFDSSVFEGIMDLLMSGQFVLFADYDIEKEELFFELWNLSGCYFSSSRLGAPVDTLIREYSLTKTQAETEFGTSCPKEITLSTDDNKLHPFAHAIYPNPKGVVGAQIGKAKLVKSEHMYLATGEIIRESGYDEFPLAIPRWNLIPDSAYAVGLVYEALPDIKTLNMAAQFVLQNAEMAICGMWGAVDDGVLNTGSLVIGPRKVAVMAEAGNLFPLQPGGNFQVAIAELQGMRDQVRKSMMVDQVQIPQEGTKTAYEISVRMGMLRQLTGPVFGRLQSEFARIVERCFWLLVRNGRIPPPPKEMEGITKLGVRYVSPMARSQRNEEVNAIEQFEAALMNTSQVNPGILDVYNFDDGQREKAKLMGVPQNLINDVKTVNKTRDARAKAQQAAAQQEAMQGAPIATQ